MFKIEPSQEIQEFGHLRFLKTNAIQNGSNKKNETSYFVHTPSNTILRYEFISENEVQKPTSHYIDYLDIIDEGEKLGTIKLEILQTDVEIINLPSFYKYCIPAITELIGDDASAHSKANKLDQFIDLIEEYETLSQETIQDIEDPECFKNLPLYVPFYHAGVVFIQYTPMPIIFAINFNRKVAEVSVTKVNFPIEKTELAPIIKEVEQYANENVEILLNLLEINTGQPKQK